MVDHDDLFVSFLETFSLMLTAQILDDHKHRNHYEYKYLSYLICPIHGDEYEDDYFHYDDDDSMIDLIHN
ncbi:hypothetical protein DERF_006475 [Dermatophagoides farinae]|uniref:Uncharacterized protein n=1 Tax=Dermatophagoides farinae TaxID=6954 RepID=A0A922I5I3_DERFA|nr:hypothetical protein DERF_006475 [Dermatophagoides farinae]